MKLKSVKVKNNNKFQEKSAKVKELSQNIINIFNEQNKHIYIRISINNLFDNRWEYGI